MSTEIKNTLFRFVTMRAPELSNEKNKNKRFIFRGENLKEDQVRPFDDVIKTKPNSTSKWNAMKVCSFDQAFNDEKTAKTFNEPFYNLGIWIARNKNSYSVSDLLAEIEKNGIQKELNIFELDTLWNNLFYQVVTQKDFHVKESVMQMLIANHVYINLIVYNPQLSLETAEKIPSQSLPDNVRPVLDTELIKYIINAKVVLPKELFVEDKVAIPLSSGKTAKIGEIDIKQPMMTLPSLEIKRAQDITSAQTNIEKNNLLKKELEKAEKKYRREYQDAYSKEQENYQALIKPIFERYNQEVRDSNDKWCSIRDPKIPYDPTDPCNQIPTIPQPELPKFNFEFKNEMNLDYLKEVLSERSFITLLELLEIETKEVKDNLTSKVNSVSKLLETVPIDTTGDGYTYGDTYTQIANSTTQNTQVIINNTPSQSTTSVSIGGVIVPLVTTSTVAPFSYQICPKQNKNDVEFYLTIELPDSSLSFIPSNSYVQVYNASGGMGGFSLASKNGTSICLKVIASYPLNDDLTATKIEGTIKFSNGMIKSFSIPTSTTDSIFKSCFSGVLTNKDGSNTTLDSSTSNNGSTLSNTSDNTFIPSGFGVKQLGIADYKKVEQTVQGYVEGEVAAIENIMAREYKEKATRKLRRSENTTTSTSESEREQLSDTTNTSRFEMQSEVASVLLEAKDFSAGVNSSYTSPEKTFTIGGNVNMASHSSKEESNRQAITQAKDVTERAMERIVTKVKQERIEKIVEEFEENNKHGFDNTKGDKHVVGVYRWVDKIYKNQVLNFGKRLMFEFMVPEPAKLHLLGMTENKQINGTILTEPIDPRKANLHNLSNYSIIDETMAQYWGGVFNVDLNPRPSDIICIGKSFNYKATEIISNAYERAAESVDLEIPEGYYAIKASAVANHSNDDGVNEAKVIVGGINADATFKDVSNFTYKIPVSYSQLGFLSSSVNISVQCKLTSEAKTKWQQETFKAIIDAYDEAVKQYNQKLAEEGAKGDVIKGENPGFYRQFENLILRKNCISYIISQDETKKRTYGRDMFKPTASGVTTAFNNLEVNVNADLDDYAAFAKFIEQAFEWDIMSYNFYPYYWGAKKDWAQLYQYDNNDPLFRNFMQAGMARVIVSVRPGFEEAVSYYMQTGQIWNGGEVPVIEDKLFMSIVDELREPVGKLEGKAWWTRLPTALTILQADSIGLKVTKALPFNDKDLNDFENPSGVPRSEGLDISYDVLGTTQKARIVGKITGNENKEAKIVLKKMDNTVKDLTYCDPNGNWELNDIAVGKYQLQLDANDDFPNTTYQITVGTKNQTVELSGDQVLEINLTVAPLN